MNFVCDRTTLYEALSTASKGIAAKSAVPILSCFRIGAELDGKLTVTGFDMDIGVTTRIDVETIREGAVAVDAKLLTDIIRNMDSGPVSLILNTNRTLNIRNGNSEYVLPCQDAGSYPELPSPDDSVFVTISQSMLHSMLRQTIFAISQSETKGPYTGVYFNASNGKLEIVCTDTFKFALRREQYDGGRDFAFIAQGRAIGELIKIMKNGDGVVSIGISKSHAIFDFDNTRMISRLVSGAYMNYEKVIPKSCKYEVSLRCPDIKRIFERASVLISEKTKAPVVMNFEHGKLFVSCRTADGQSFDDETDAYLEGGPFEIGVNNRNFLDLIASCECDDILVRMNTPVTPMCVIPKEGAKFLFLIAPMRITGSDQK